MTAHDGRGRRVPVKRRLLALPALALLLAGCGIRPTEVPTDFGAAPSRVPCSLSGPDLTTQTSHGVPVQVFLLCGSSLVAVDRVVRVPEGTADARRRVIVAQGLLNQLATPPSATEKAAGYTTHVPSGLTVAGPHPKDPEDTLRLSTDPSGLNPYALAQIVCTLSDSAAAEGNGSVVLGGPDDSRLRRYECTDQLRSRPGTTRPPSTEATDG
ncbi:GerMN domain-containing protein [Streptomyces carpinensis]|uniref:GerMN domain-containing protein n=1 Tax=Streptomyces carpinensis TaxID=66369 RepID=UPI001FCA25C9|nr:GerMN domain-containing protein [Streptomyces carpinensis]